MTLYFLLLFSVFVLLWYALGDGDHQYSYKGLEHGYNKILMDNNITIILKIFLDKSSMSKGTEEHGYIMPIFIFKTARTS